MVQVTKKQPKPSSGNSSPTAKSGSSSPDVTEDGRGAPAMANLLDHIAWNVLCANAEEFSAPDFRSDRLVNWGNGRGGFLADEMVALHDASARLQVPSHHLLPVRSAVTTVKPELPSGCNNGNNLLLPLPVEWR